MSLTAEHFSSAYINRIADTYGRDMAEQVDNWREAPLPHRPGESLPYIRLNPGAGTPLLYVPGFTEGIAAKAPFAAELANRGYDVILPDQNRSKVLRNPATGKKDATYSLAIDTLPVLSAEGIERADAITHSYGSLVFEEMVRLAMSEGKKTFRDSNLVMLTPAGLNEDEHFFGIGWRLAKSVVKENATAKDFPDDGDMMKAGLRGFFRNPARTLRQGYEASQRRLDTRSLASMGKLIIFSYAEDEIYPDRVIADGAVKAVASGACWVVPISLQKRDYGLRLGRDASHNDEQFNPSRVAAAVAQILEARRS